VAVISESQKISNHCLTLEDCKRLRVSGIRELGSYSERNVTVFMEFEKLVVAGSGLKVEKLCVENGELELSGKILSFTYSARKRLFRRGFFSKFFGRK
jgi:sporulation protein YabP